MKLEILGMGCMKCKTLYDNAKKAVEEAGIQADVLKVEDINKITEYGVMAMPALVIDGQVKVSGRIPEPAEIKKWIS
ncbi:MAG: TM0996/MTH895 family glutaredoxin-like protein [Candidatus Omnitrophica bacterium]|nr:TM0996/MTH895 family glutaredoxin-like protein [Candidatus Omnitrophota bacterium]